MTFSLSNSSSLVTSHLVENILIFWNSFRNWFAITWHSSILTSQSNTWIQCVILLYFVIHWIIMVNEEKLSRIYYKYNLSNFDLPTLTLFRSKHFTKAYPISDAAPVTKATWFSRPIFFFALILNVIISNIRILQFY